jgi:hypothetical protein
MSGKYQQSPLERFHAFRRYLNSNPESDEGITKTKTPRGVGPGALGRSRPRGDSISRRCIRMYKISQADRIIKTAAGKPDFESDDFKALALCREWKQRLRDLIETYYYKTPLKERQWWKLQEIAGECARIPGTTRINNVDFLCRAIFRGEFKDNKGRMQVANLHSSPLAPLRLDVKWLSFDQLLKRADHLFVRRKECIECLARNNIDVPRTWLPSELTSPNEHKPPPVEECWQVIDKPLPRKRALHRAWPVIRRIWPDGPPRSMSMQQIANRMGRGTKPFAASTVERLLKRLT